MQEKKKIPWGLLYVLLTVVILLVFGLSTRNSTAWCRCSPGFLLALSRWRC